MLAHKCLRFEDSSVPHIGRFRRFNVDRRRDDLSTRDQRQLAARANDVAQGRPTQLVAQQTRDTQSAHRPGPRATHVTRSAGSERPRSLAPQLHSCRADRMDDQTVNGGSAFAAILARPPPLDAFDAFKKVSRVHRTGHAASGKACNSG